MNVNEAQLAAIEHKDGPALVLAGPGSGKTLVITRRTCHLIEKWGVNPSNILVITFTRASAMEMKERFLKLMGKENTNVTFGTFHSVFFRILKLAYNYTAENIVREEQRWAFMQQAIRESGAEIEDESEFISSVLSEISLVKNERISLEHYYSKSCPEQLFKQLYGGYESWLRRSRLIDFDDMQGLCYELFLERPDILSAWQRKYQYILIDEFQDICRIQYEIVRMLARPRDNLFIVGDDDQSIYRFRGANPEIMLGFEKDYPGAKKILLDVNYRCDGFVIQKAHRLISNNQVRFKKAVRAARDAKNPVEIREFADLTEENRQVVEEMRKFLDAGGRAEEMAVLYRTNLCPRQLAGKLMEYNIPFSMKDSIPNLYDHWIARDILAYIRLALGARERGLFLQIANRPNRYLKRDSFSESQMSFELLYEYYEGKEWMVERIEKLEYDLKVIGRLKPFGAVNYIRKAVGYEEYLGAYAEFRRMKPEELYDIVDEIQESAADFSSFEEWFDHIESYTEELKLQAAKNQQKKEGVTLATMHSSKGLEFKKVFLIDANEGITPHRKAVLDADIEEERRLFYVAMTRAKENLHIYYTRERYHRKQTVSRFVEELV